MCFLQGERVAELLLHHARAHECQDIPQFKKEMAELVDHALRNTVSLGKVLKELCAILFSLRVSDIIGWSISICK